MLYNGGSVNNGKNDNGQSQLNKLQTDYENFLDSGWPAAVERLMESNDKAADTLHNHLCSLSTVIEKAIEIGDHEGGNKALAEMKTLAQTAVASLEQAAEQPPPCAPPMPLGEQATNVNGDSDESLPLLELVKTYLAAGISLVPIGTDGAKQPAFDVLPRLPPKEDPSGPLGPRWYQLQEELPTLDEAQDWVADGRHGIAAVCGKVSGNLEILDFDDIAAYEPWKQLVETEMPGLVDRLTQHRTPRPGRQIAYRCSVIAGNTILAQVPVQDPKTGKLKAETLIETRGEGGYALLPGCPAACHPTGRLYEHVAGPPITEAAVITPEERELLWMAARCFHTWVDDRELKDGPESPSSAGNNEGRLRPGDDFNRRGPSWMEIISPYGWVEISPGRVRRPGKDRGSCSATIGFCKARDGSALLAVFSSNAYPFEGPSADGRICTCYSKFRAYTLLNHNGDFSAAASDLARQGYGERWDVYIGQRRDDGAGNEDDKDDSQRAAEEKGEQTTGEDGAQPADDGHASADESVQGDGQGHSSKQTAGTPVIELMDSATFDAAEYHLTWHIKKVLVQHQPAVVGGPKKALKTSLLCDLAISIGTGLPFLGHFETVKSRIGFISGESGPHTIQDTARNVCRSKGITLAEAGVWWGFRLPQLSIPAQLRLLDKVLRDNGLQAITLDPLYLCLLNGNLRAQASNLFDMGPLLAEVSSICLDAGATPILCHHDIKRLANPYATPELEDLAFSGIQEFARQWLLVGRREKYEPGTGSHKLWLNIGGSASFSSLWAIDVNEGILDDDFKGKTWHVQVEHAAAAIEGNEEKKKQAKETKELADDARVLKALDRVNKEGGPPTYTRVRNMAGLSNQKMSEVVSRLEAQGSVEFFEVEVRSGKNTKKMATGLGRKAN